MFCTFKTRHFDTRQQTLQEGSKRELRNLGACCAISCWSDCIMAVKVDLGKTTFMLNCSGSPQSMIRFAKHKIGDELGLQLEKDETLDFIDPNGRCFNLRNRRGHGQSFLFRVRRLQGVVILFPGNGSSLVGKGGSQSKGFPRTPW